MAGLSEKVIAVVDTLKNQHDQVVQIVEELNVNLDEVKTIDNAIKAKASLEELISILSTHLQIEDDILYPALKKSQDQKLKDCATLYSDEMGNIAKELRLYAEKWTTSTSIADRPEDFINETKKLVAILLKRIDRENNELFPLLIASL